MANGVKLTAFLVLSSYLNMCYSSSRPRPDDATVILFFNSNEQDSQKKEQDFSTKLSEVFPRIRFEEGTSINKTFGRFKFYKVQLTLTLSAQVRTIVKELDIKKFVFIPPRLSFVTVEYTFPSEEYEFLEELKKVNIPVIRKEEWLQRSPIFLDFPEYPHVQEYYVVASLKSEAEDIASRLGILQRVYKEMRPEYVVVKFAIGLDKMEFLRKLKEEANIQLREIKGVQRLKLLREYLLDYYALYRFKTIAKESGVSDIAYNMTKLSPVFLTFYFDLDEYDFEEKLKEANIHFEKYEGDFQMDPKVNEYIVEASLVEKVQEMSSILHIELS